MAYALIDNATLTAVDRLLGKIKIRSGDSIDSVGTNKGTGYLLRDIAVGLGSDQINNPNLLS